MKRETAIKAVAKFNSECPIGTPVTVRMDSGILHKGTVKYPAEISSNGYPWVWVTGIRGAYLLDRVEKIKDGLPNGL